MTRKFCFALAGCALMAGVAFAGRQTNLSVAIVDTYDPVTDMGRNANGSFGAAYNSANSVEQIGCSIIATATSVVGLCRAVDPTGLARICVTGNPAHIEIIRELRTDSWLFFQWGPSSLCRKIWVRSFSESPPKR